jgi:hypothetical protein
MSVQIDCISSCCGAEIRVDGGAPDFMGSNYVCTMCYVCTHCGKPCDWKSKEPNLCISQWTEPTGEYVNKDKNNEILEVNSKKLLEFIKKHSLKQKPTIEKLMDLLECSEEEAKNLL